MMYQLRLDALIFIGYFIIGIIHDKMWPERALNGVLIETNVERDKRADFI